MPGGAEAAVHLPFFRSGESRLTRTLKTCDPRGDGTPREYTTRKEEQMDRQTFALYFANRGFFPGSLIAGARAEMIEAVEKAGYGWIAMDEGATRYGAVETPEEGRRYAAFLEANKGKYDGILMSLPNFGDENGACAAMRDAEVPIYIQAYPDEIGKMDFEHRRDSYCGKFSIMDMFNQYGIKYTVFPQHVAHPLSEGFAENLETFAAVCRVVRANRRFTIGGIGARTTAFKTVRCDEVALQKYGITVESYDLSELFDRMRKMEDKRPALLAKQEELREYTDLGGIPDAHFGWLSKMGVVVDDMILENGLDTVSIRCWNEMHQQFGVAPCVLLGMLNSRGIAASCEMDIANVVTMRALAAASRKPAMCLDWNNNYGDDPDRVILFHCGPIASELMEDKGTLGVHKMFAKGNHPDQGWGINAGRIAKAPITYASAATLDGKLLTYVGEGEVTGEPIEEEYFGCAGVARIDDLQPKLIYMGKSGFRHHTTATQGHVAKAVAEAFVNYLGYETTAL